MAKQLVLAGGGHAHMTTLTQLSDFTSRGHRVTLVSPSEFHYYSGMGPGLLAGTYRPEQVRFNVRQMALNGGAEFIQGRIVRVDADNRRLELENGASLSYDVVSFNTGSGVPLQRVGAAFKAAVAVKPIENLLELRHALLAELGDRALRLVVIGGGPAGVELAGNLWRLLQEAGGRAEITLVSGHRLLPGFPGRVSRLALASLEGRGIRVLEHERVHGVRDGSVALASGGQLQSDYTLVAAGVEPSPIFGASGLAVGEDGGLLVNSQLQSVDFPEIFGGGDCICFRDRPLPKVGVYAVRQNPVLHHNLMAALEGEPLQRFRPQRGYLLILNLGDGRGILNKGLFTSDGRWAFWLKDWIDRHFMMEFQRFGERA